MATQAQPVGRALAASEGLGLFDLLWLALQDFIHIIQQLKFGILLILVLAVMVSIGSYVPQTVFNDDPQMYLDEFGATGYYWIIALGLDRIFRTGYFAALVILLVVSVTLCAFGRLKAYRMLARNKRPHTSVSEIEGTRFNGYLELPGGSVPELLERMRRRGYAIVTREGSRGETQLLARKGLSAKVANVSMHFGFIVLAVGTGIGQITQLAENTLVVPEGSVEAHPLHGQFAKPNPNGPVHLIRCAEYFQEYDPAAFPDRLAFFSNSFPTDFKSHLQVIDQNGTVLKDQTIEVNEPLIHEGVYYYQQSFIQLPSLTVSHGDEPSETITLQPTQPARLHGYPNPIEILEQGSVAGGYYLNPDGTRGEEMPFLVRLFEWVPSNRAGFVERRPLAAAGDGSGILQVGESVELPADHGPPIVLTLQGVEEGTVLQVKRDRGIPIMYFAFVVIVFGILYPLFYPYHDGRFVFQPIESPDAEGSQGVRIWWGSRYRAGRRSFINLLRVWQGLKPVSEDDDMRGEFVF